jgi:hypothetical protein
MPPSVKAPVAMIAATTWITSHGDCSASRSGTTGVYSRSTSTMRVTSTKPVTTGDNQARANLR